MRLKKEPLAFSAAIIIATSAFLIIRQAIHDDAIRKTRLLQTVTELTGQTIRQVTIAPDPLSRKQIHVTVSGDDDLREITELLRHADIKGVGGHNGSIYESTVIFTTSSGTQTFLASAHRYNPDDAYFSDTFWSAEGGGRYSCGSPTRVRVPALGRWLIAHTPKNGR